MRILAAYPRFATEIYKHNLKNQVKLVALVVVTEKYKHNLKTKPCVDNYRERLLNYHKIRELLCSVEIYISPNYI